MRMNRFETLVVNGPLRRGFQRYVGIPRLLRLGGRLDDPSSVLANTANGGSARRPDALEIGCGRGLGLLDIARRFGAVRVDGIDLDPAMVARATRRAYARTRGPNPGLAGAIRVRQGDACDPVAVGGPYDGVFSLEALHHVRDWRRALHVATAALRPGGRLYLEETLAPALNVWWIRSAFRHPGDRFTADQLNAHVHEVGLVDVRAQVVLGGRVICLVARKPASR